MPDELFVREATSLGQSIHSFSDFEEDVSVLIGQFSQIVLVDDFLRNLADVDYMYSYLGSGVPR